MARLNWDNLGIDWNFSYLPTVIDKPYSGSPYISVASTEVIIKGTIQPMVLTCQNDVDSLSQWFRTGHRKIRCPVFFRAPLAFEGHTSYYDSVQNCIRFNTSYPTSSFRTPYSFFGAYYVGSNADSNFNVIDPLLPIEFKVEIAPVKKGFKYGRASKKQPMHIEAIDFVVVPRKPFLPNRLIYPTSTTYTVTSGFAPPSSTSYYQN